MRRRSRSVDDDELSDEAPATAEDEDEGEGGAPRSHSRHGRSRGAGVHEWKADPEEDGEEGETATGRFSRLRRAKRPVFFRARDSLYFEPLVGLAIIVVLLVSLYAYTQNWPPLYVVESSSMQHGYTDQVGLINTGDLVLAKQIPANEIIPYVVGQRTQYATYGEYGDVILYHPNGNDATVPVIHRVLLYLEWAGGGSYNAPSLQGLPCGTSNALYSTPGTNGGCNTTGLTGTIDLFHVGWESVTVSLILGGLGSYSGFVTMGDNNFQSGGSYGTPDQQDGTSGLVQPSWIVGVARGMIPWFGSLKLLLTGQAADVPIQSWEFMGITIAGFILAGFGIHYILRAEGVEDERRKAEEAAEETDDSDEEPSKGPAGRGLRPWHEVDDDEEDEPKREKHHWFFRRSSSGERPARFRRGRPHPAVRPSKRRRNKAAGSHHRESKDEL